MCRSLFILARHCRTNLKLRIASPALDSKINFVWYCDRFCFCRKLCQTETMILSAFSIFLREKNASFCNTYFCMSHRNPLSIGFQLRRRAQHFTTILYKQRFYANNTYQCRTHINIASILLHCNLLSIRSLDTTLIQKISLYATSFPRRFHATPTTLERCAPCHNTACLSPLDLRFNSTE